LRVASSSACDSAVTFSIRITVVTCPALPGLVTEGNTYAEARNQAVEAIEGYLESLQKDGLPARI
jgi:predicted RNase H-like HicB family nuclease